MQQLDRMTAEEALERVRTIYAESGRKLSEDVSVRPGDIRPGGWFSARKKTWVVRTNTNLRGGNRVFEFDAETGELLKDFVLPR